MVNHRFRLPDDARKLLREKNAATGAYDAYPTEKNLSRLRFLQRAVKKRIVELRNNHWDDLLKEITLTHLAYWKFACL